VAIPGVDKCLYMREYM